MAAKSVLPVGYERSPQATGMERIVSTLHEAVISLSERETVDVKAMPAELKAPYLRVALVETLKLTARKTS